MLKEDKKTGSAPYYKPLQHELTDCFTSTNAPAPGATYSSTTGELNTDDSNTNNNRNTSQRQSGQAAEDDIPAKKPRGTSYINGINLTKSQMFIL